MLERQQKHYKDMRIDICQCMILWSCWHHINFLPLECQEGEHSYSTYHISIALAVPDRAIEWYQLLTVTYAICIQPVDLLQLIQLLDTIQESWGVIPLTCTTMCTFILVTTISCMEKYHQVRSGWPTPCIQLPEPKRKLGVIRSVEKLTIHTSDSDSIRHITWWKSRVSPMTNCRIQQTAGSHICQYRTIKCCLVFPVDQSVSTSAVHLCLPYQVNYCTGPLGDSPTHLLGTG